VDTERHGGGRYAEVDAPVTKGIDLTGAVRVDRFSACRRAWCSPRTSPSRSAAPG
jgi:hypothetical protein